MAPQILAHEPGCQSDLGLQQRHAVADVRFAIRGLCSCLADYFTNSLTASVALTSPCHSYFHLKQGWGTFLPTG